MKNIKELISHNRIFLSLYLLFLVVGGLLIGTMEKGHEILYFNSLHTPFFDQFFKWTSEMAEWPLILFILVVAIRVSYGKGLLMGINSLVNLAIVQLLKWIVFANQVRPSVFFEGKAQLNFVDGVRVEHFHSFPSGHTAAAFALCFMATILIHDKRWTILFFILALLVGIARVYLLQHFFRDVYFGSMVGVVFTAIFYLAFESSSFYQNLSWKDKSLFHD